jgi:enterochelin esterase-like enzyme/sugar lactone lactonase YvrE
MRIRLALIALLAALSIPAADEYTLGPDSQRHTGVPQGKVAKFTITRSKIFPGAAHDYWVYVPAQYDGSKPACLMVFQDGAGFASETGSWRVPVVFDNLIAQGAMPATIAVMIDPGILPAVHPQTQQNRYNRSYEYDGLGDRYVRFLIEEILPEVGKQFKLSADPNDRAIAGSSSGGIAAFTAAWERPDAFRRVLSFIGSFTNLQGGDVYANLIRKMEPKPLRIFLQDGSNDLNIYSGSWYLANQAVAKSLEYSGYDSKFVAGAEGHNSKHGSAIFPDALRWLWRDYPRPIGSAPPSTVERHFISEILDPGHDWEPVGGAYQATDAPAVDRDGNVYFSDYGASVIYKAATDGTVTVFRRGAGSVNGLMFGADGRLYAVESARKRVVVYEPSGGVTVLASGLNSPNDLAVSPSGDVYFSETYARRIWLVPARGGRRLVYDGDHDRRILMPNGVRLSPDHSLLVVADTEARAWSFQVEPDGSLANGEPFYHLELPDQVSEGPLRSGADGLTFDDRGYDYFTTKLGVQICDQPGRVVGIIRPPSTADLSNLVFGGADMQWLYATAGGNVYRRHLRRKGVFPWAPVKLPRPEL